MKIKPYFLRKIKVKNLKCRLLQYLFGDLRVNIIIPIACMVTRFPTTDILLLSAKGLAKEIIICNLYSVFLLLKQSKIFRSVFNMMGLDFWDCFRRGRGLSIS